MEWTDVGQLVFTGVSMAGAVFAWWQAHGSKKARTAAEEAERNAKRQADGVDSIAESMRLPDLGFEFRRWVDEATLETVFVNRTGAPVHVEEVRHDGPRGFVTDVFRRGATVDLAETANFICLFGGEIPAQAEFVVDNQRRTFRIPRGPAS